MDQRYNRSRSLWAGYETDISKKKKPIFQREENILRMLSSLFSRFALYLAGRIKQLWKRHNGSIGGCVVVVVFRKLIMHRLFFVHKKMEKVKCLPESFVGLVFIHCHLYILFSFVAQHCSA